MKLNPDVFLKAAKICDEQGLYACWSINTALNLPIGAMSPYNAFFDRIFPWRRDNKAGNAAWWEHWRCSEKTDTNCRVIALLWCYQECKWENRRK